jgi:hypothetical protein
MMNMQNRFGWSRKLEGNMQVHNITEERKVLEVKIEERSAEHAAEVFRILSESGAIEARIEEHTDNEFN